MARALQTSGRKPPLPTRNHVPTKPAENDVAKQPTAVPSPQAQSFDLDRTYLSCAVCLEILHNPVNVNPCNHKFCSSCAYIWMDRNQGCPKCRNDIQDINEDGFVAKICEEYLRSFPDQRRSQEVKTDLDRNELEYLEKLQDRIRTCAHTVDFDYGRFIFRISTSRKLKLAPSKFRDQQWEKRIRRLREQLQLPPRVVTPPPIFDLPATRFVRDELIYNVFGGRPQNIRNTARPAAASVNRRLSYPNNRRLVTSSPRLTRAERYARRERRSQGAEREQPPQDYDRVHDTGSRLIMALLNKLMYYGIRSVPGDSKDKIYLEFESPLTIIWGPNGSGKTTLIEALKFVTANEAPPGDKQAFVHNLKLARSQRVDSLIMLEFTSEKKKRVTVTKRFNAAATTKNKAGLQFKSDESTINIHDEQGKVRSVSSKNADFQAEVLSHLGVPAAILSNVIFCHQEDSCWPLSESRELKIRFDKIFQLQKFTKAIDQAKKIRKDQATKMKLFKSEADHHALLMTNKGRFLKTKSDTKEEYLNNQKALEKLAESIAEKTVELEKMEAEIKKSEVQRRQRDILMTQLAIFRKTITNIEAQDIEPFSGSMEELEEQKKQVLQQMENEKQHDSARILREIKWNLEQKKQERERCQQELNEAIRRKDNYEQTMIEVAEMQQTIIQRFPFVAEEGGAANLVEEIPRLVAQRRRLLEEAKRLNMLTRRNLQQQYEETSSALTRAQADISFIGQNRSKVSKEVAEVERKLAMAEKLLKGENVLIVLRPDEIKAEQVRVAQELKRTRKELAPLDTKADLYETWIAETSEKSCCPLCERKFIDQGGAECLVQKLNDMTLLLPDDTSRLTQRVTKLELEEGILIAALKDAERLVSLQPSLQDLDEKLAQKRRQLPELEQMVQSRKKRISDGEQDIVDKEQGGEGELKELDMAHRNLVVLKKKAEQIFTPEQQMEQLRNQLKRLEAEYNDCLVQQSNADNSNSRYTKIMERKRYIDRQLELLEITKRIDSIQVDLGALNVPGDQDSQYMHMEFQKKTSSLNQDVMIKAKIEGQMVEIKRKNKEVKKELETDAMKNAEMTFRNTLINKAVCEKIMEDLDSFVAVLDQSILKFHKDKMTAINVILDDLWRKVYNGVDIETIRIKTEKNEGADKRASYDYMVMMVLEGGVEVGMKDRCSAGQKMLASLLIRIALADVFAKTCSIIALDEPTTNLDTVKIEQMSAMLNTLIATRRADDRQGNVQGKQFQMVVITHDERLVNALKLGCRPGRTFRISKDPLSGKSRLDAYDYAGNKIDA